MFYFEFHAPISSQKGCRWFIAGILSCYIKDFYAEEYENILKTTDSIWWKTGCIYEERSEKNIQEYNGYKKNSR